MRTCTGCGKDEDFGRSKRTWWHCTKYFGISGYFCPECYDMISHDTYKNPKNPAAYTMMLLKLTPTT